MCVVCCVSVGVEFCAVWLLLPRADRGRRGERCGSCCQEPEYLVTWCNLRVLCYPDT